jgi:hypothetical protein
MNLAKRSRMFVIKMIKNNTEMTPDEFGNKSNTFAVPSLNDALP